ncbi:MAG TPA: DegV family protein [Spirochaetia bacterium]|jgi:DegV family protein with EDD domain|nr:DegV family protein [Spirochaetia bacterium]
MEKIRIATCSETGMPAKLAEELGIHIVPYVVTFNGKSWLEPDVDATLLYREMRESKALPTTAHPSVGDYLDRFRQWTDDGSIVIYIALSPFFSKAVDVARTARAQLPDRDIRIIDMKCATAAQGILAILAAQALKSGATAEEIIALIEKAAHRERVLIVFETLKFLARGGRINTAKALLGSVLQIKPVLTVNEEGKTAPFGRVRTRSEGIDFIVKQIEKDLVAHNSQSLDVVIEDSDEKEWAARLRERLEREFHIAQLWQWTMSPIVGSHIGPGAFGVSYHCR